MEEGGGGGEKSPFALPKVEKETTDPGVGSGALPWKSGASTLAYFRPTANKGSLLRPLSQAYNLKRPVKPSIRIPGAANAIEEDENAERRGRGAARGWIRVWCGYAPLPVLHAADKYSETRIRVEESVRACSP